MVGEDGHGLLEQQRDAVDAWWFTLNGSARDAVLALGSDECIDEAMALDLLLYGVLLQAQLCYCLAQPSGYRQPQALVDLLTGLRRAW